MSGNKCKHLVLIKRNGFARCKIVRTDDRLLIGCGAVGICTCQVCNNAVGNISYICGSCLHIGIVHRREHSCKVIRCKRYRIFGIYRLGIYYVFDRLVVIVVVKHHQMNLEYLCVSFSDLFECFFVNLGKLFCGKLLCRFYSLLFLFGIFNVYACYCRIALFEHGYFSYCHCAVYAFAKIFLHYCSPFFIG